MALELQFGSIHDYNLCFVEAEDHLLFRLLCLFGSSSILVRQQYVDVFRELAEPVVHFSDLALHDEDNRLQEGFCEVVDLFSCKRLILLLYAITLARKKASARHMEQLVDRK